jgi:hypothetical protein
MDVLVVLLNFMREENVTRIIGSLREQSIPLRIALWNNGAAKTFPDLDFQIESPENLRCMARWHMASLLGNEYVAFLDDDLEPARRDLFELCVEKCRDYGNERIVGRSGKSIGSPPRYYKSGAQRGIGDGLSTPGDVFADIIKGRFMFMHVDLLRRVPLYCPYYVGRGDDIWASLKTSTERSQHVIPEFMRDGFDELPGKDTALCGESGHNEMRDDMVRAMLRNGEIAWTTTNPVIEAGSRIRGMLRLGGRR